MKSNYITKKKSIYTPFTRLGNRMFICFLFILQLLALARKRSMIIALLWSITSSYYIIKSVRNSCKSSAIDFSVIKNDCMFKLKSIVKVVEFVLEGVSFEAITISWHWIFCWVNVYFLSFYRSKQIIITKIYLHINKKKTLRINYEIYVRKYDLNLVNYWMRKVKIKNFIFEIMHFQGNYVFFAFAQ
jgi:hypothetical protein